MTHSLDTLKGLRQCNCELPAGVHQTVRVFRRMRVDQKATSAEIGLLRRTAGDAETAKLLRHCAVTAEMEMRGWGGVGWGGGSVVRSVERSCGDSAAFTSSTEATDKLKQV